MDTDYPCRSSHRCAPAARSTLYEPNPSDVAQKRESSPRPDVKMLVVAALLALPDKINNRYYTVVNGSRCARLFVGSSTCTCNLADETKIPGRYDRIRLAWDQARIQPCRWRRP